MVAPDGETYERAAFLEKKRNDDNNGDDTGRKVYPNRALKLIMDDMMIGPHGDSFQASSKRWQSLTKTAMNGYFYEPYSVSTDTLDGQEATYDPLSEGFYCPITFNIMHDPVIEPNGHSYEKAAVENWIRLHGTSPVTRTALKMEELYPNHAISRLLQEESSKPDSESHPEIRKWKVEPAPKSSDIEYGGGIVVAMNTEESSSSQRSLLNMSADEYVRYRRRAARRQTLLNLAGLVVCILLLRFVHGRHYKP